jgi:nucleobase:cation symporter-1, NCS1 family
MTGFVVSGLIFYVLNILFPPEGMSLYEETDLYGTFTAREAARLGVVPTIEAQAVDNYSSYAIEESDQKKS